MKRLMKYLFKKQSTVKRATNVFDRQYFHTNLINEELKIKGFCILNILDEQDINTLRNNLSVYQRSITLNRGFYSSGNDSVENRILAKDLSWQCILPKLEKIIDIDKAHIAGGAWLVKPSGYTEGLAPHQDDSIVDETKSFSVYAWVPLQDVSVKNGCMYAIPGSHLWGNHYRSLNVPWIFDKYAEIFTEYSLPIEMNAGNILLFDSALIHGSYENKGQTHRAALHFVCKPKNADYQHYYTDDRTPKGKIESYKIDMDFYLKEDIRKKPNIALYPFQGYVDEINLKLNKSKIRKLLKESKRIG